MEDTPVPAPDSGTPAQPAGAGDGTPKPASNGAGKTEGTAAKPRSWASITPSTKQAAEPKKKPTTRIFQRPTTDIKELELKIKRLELLHQSARDFVSALKLDELMKTVFREVIEVLQAEAGSLWLVEDGGLVCRVADGPETTEIVGLRLPMGTGVVGWCANKGESAIVYDTSKDKRFSKSADRRTGFQTKSMISVPMKFRDEVLGVIQVINRRGTADSQFTDDDLHMLEDLATYAAISINNARLYESQQRVQILNTLLKVSSELTSSLDVDSILVSIVNGTNQVVPYERAAIAMEHNGKARLASVSGIAKIDQDDPKLRQLATALEYLFSRNRDEWIPDVDKALAEGALPPALAEYFRITGVKAFWARLLKDEEGVLGIFMMESGKTNFVNDMQQEVLNILCNQATVAIRNAQLYSKVPFASVWEGFAGKKSWWHNATPKMRAVAVAIVAAFILVVFVIPNPFTTISADFSVEPSRTIPMYAPIDGRIAKVAVREGDNVEKGALLVAFDTRDLETALKQKRLELESIRQRMGEDSAKASRNPRLALDYESTQAEIDALIADINKAVLTSPVSGVVVGPELKNLEGKPVIEAADICSIENLSVVELKIAVKEENMRYVSPDKYPEGQHVTFKTSSFRGTAFSGKIARINPVGERHADGHTVFYAIVELENPPAGLDGKLLKGMTGRAEVEIESMTIFGQFLHWLGLS